MEMAVLGKHLKNFDLMWHLIENTEVMEIIETISQFNNIEMNTLANMPMGGYLKDKTSGSYYHVLKDLKDNLYNYLWLEKNLTDDRSKVVYLNLLKFRIYPMIDYLKLACDKDHDQYFDPKIVQCDENEVFVDCGGYIGDTIESFIKNFKTYKKIYSYEPSEENLKKFREVVKNFNNITLRPYGLGKKEDEISFIDTGSSSSFLEGLDDADSQKVKITSLDTDILEPVSFIKMDIEGSEIDALIGAEHHISNDHPKLAICVYHLVSDLWEIPRLIIGINPDYHLYLRHYRDDRPWETVIYAIPKEKSHNIILVPNKEQ